MKRVTMVRYTTQPGKAEENAALSHAVFDRVRANAPDHVAYALFRDGDDWVHLFVNTAADNSDDVTGLPEFEAFGENISARCLAPPDVTRLSVELVDSYGYPA